MSAQFVFSEATESISRWYRGRPSTSVANFSYHNTLVKVFISFFWQSNIAMMAFVSFLGPDMWRQVKIERAKAHSEVLTKGKVKQSLATYDFIRACIARRSGLKCVQ